MSERIDLGFRVYHNDQWQGWHKDEVAAMRHAREIAHSQHDHGAIEVVKVLFRILPAEAHARLGRVLTG